MTPRNASTALAATVVDELVRCGVRHVVLCPGSRSAALAFAVDEAARTSRLTLHVRTDERTAGFLALGLARTGRQPVAVLTTSGTASANLHPAVLEASHAGLPLVCVTADRPAALRGTGANQTTDQVGLFGRAVRAAADVPPAWPGVREAEQVRGWRAQVARTLLTATGAGGVGAGPVHLNLQFEAPLTPETADGWTAGVDGRPDGAPWTTAAAGRVEPAPEALNAAEPTVVVAGDDAGPPARILAESAGWPLLAEPTSGARTGENAIRTYRLLLGDPSLADRIRRVVVFGHPTLSRPVTRLLGRTDLEVVAVVPPRSPVRSWTDPGHVVRRVAASVAADEPDDSGWLEEWRARDAAVASALDDLLARREGLTPHEVAGAVAAVLPPRGLLWVGASNPIRDLDLMVPRYRVGDRRMVVANRGLSGIDGSVSSAVGAALGRPATSRALALMGDLTFLHDLTGLVLGPAEPRPDLTVVVVNDDGGSIFALLEQGAPEHAAAFERVFATPHGVDLAAACAAADVPHTRVTDLEGVREALERPARGIEVLEAVVRRDDRRELDAEIRGLAAR